MISPTTSVSARVGDIGNAFTLRLAYERHWIDFSEANSTPTLDQVKLGFAVRY